MGRNPALTVRPFDPTADEYAAVVAVHNAAWPDERVALVQDWQENDREWPDSALFQRVVATEEESGPGSGPGSGPDSGPGQGTGRVVGVGACFERYWQHQPGTVHLDIQAHPDRPDAYPLLYHHLLSLLYNHSPRPQVLATATRADRLDRVAFLEAQGFHIAMRSPRSALAVADHDPSPFHGLEARLAEQGIRLHTLHHVMARAQDWKERLRDLRWALLQDVPEVEPPVRPTLAEFQRMILDDPALDPAAWFLAVDTTAVPDGEMGQLVGMSNLWINDPARQRLDTGLTGVLRPYRRRGVATALKLRTIAFAQQIGAHTIDTHNEENNPMFALNLSLGFRPKPAWLSYGKVW